MEMKLVYVAGRYRGPTPEAITKNIDLAIAMGWLVREKGHYPIVPHTNTLNFEEYEEEGDGADFYLEGTLELMRRCDMVLMMPGFDKSAGALGEELEAQQLGIPVYYDVRDIPDGGVLQVTHSAHGKPRGA